MFTLATIVSSLGMLATNAPAFVALGVDLVDAFDKGKTLIASHTASTPEERVAAWNKISDLELQRDARLEELRQAG